MRGLSEVVSPVAAHHRPIVGRLRRRPRSRYPLNRAATAAVGRLRRRPTSRHLPDRAATVAVGRLQYADDVVQFLNRLCMYSLSCVYGS
uniref:Uncharacterized protein n=1 Tax=Trichuris muris TaxID=70415 RepID=A0A5S6QFQ3_TRIMR